MEKYIDHIIQTSEMSQFWIQTFRGEKMFVIKLLFPKEETMVGPAQRVY